MATKLIRIGHYSLQLARKGRMDQAVDEMGKALVVNPEHYLLRKNMAALLARKGDYGAAATNAERAAQVALAKPLYSQSARTLTDPAQVNPDDGMIHRNLAAIYNATGDGRAALEHSLKSIEVETGPHSQVCPPLSLNHETLIRARTGRQAQLKGFPQRCRADYSSQRRPSRGHRPHGSGTAMPAHTHATS